MFKNLLLAETQKSMKRSMLYIEIVLLALVTGLTMLLLYIQVSTPSDLMPAPMVELMRRSVTWPGALIEMLSMAAGNSFGGLFVVVLVGALTGQEYSWRTLHLLLSHGTPRVTWLLARAVAFLLPLLLLALTPTIVATLAAWPITQQLGGSVSMMDVSAVAVLASILRTAYTLLPYAALTLTLAIFTRSTVAAITGGLGYALLLETLAASLLPLLGDPGVAIARWLPGSLANALMLANRTASQVSIGIEATPAPNIPPLDPWVAAAGIAAYVVVLIALAAWRLRQQDLTN